MTKPVPPNLDNTLGAMYIGEPFLCSLPLVEMVLSYWHRMHHCCHVSLMANT